MDAINSALLQRAISPRHLREFLLLNIEAGEEINKMINEKNQEEFLKQKIIHNEMKILALLLELNE